MSEHISSQSLSARPATTIYAILNVFYEFSIIWLASASRKKRLCNRTFYDMVTTNIYSLID